MAGTIAICSVTIVCMVILTIFLPQIKIWKIKLSTFWMVALLGALVLLASGFISASEIWHGLTADNDINPLKILVLFFSMTVLSIFLDEVGFFKYVANQVLKKTSSSQKKLFTAFYFTISLLTIFTSNDIIILTFTPFIIYFAKSAKISPIPYLVSEFVAANTASMLLIIGNPTNIYLATANGIDFIQYLKIMAVPSVFAIITAFVVMFFLFRKKLSEPISKTIEDVKIENKLFLIIGISLLAVCIVMLTVSSYVHLAMWIIAAISAAVLLFCISVICVIKRKKPTELVNSLFRCPWELIPFVISMFIIVLALQNHGLTSTLGSFFGDQHYIVTILIYGFASVIFANLINNIPMSVFFSAILLGVDYSVSSVGVYAVIIGSNVGAFLTPMGALAGIMWLSLLKKNNVDFNFAKFVKYGTIIVLPVMLSAFCGLAISSLWI